MTGLESWTLHESGDMRTTGKTELTLQSENREWSNHPHLLSLINYCKATKDHFVFVVF
jgi:hypothetical protein